MSRKASQPQTSPQPGGGVDFLVRTMIEREATGKRPIRPKNVEDLLHSSIQDESDDPDFDCKDEDSDSDGSVESDDDEGSKGMATDHEGNEGDSDESDDEDYKEKDDSGSSDHDDDTDSDSDSSNAGGSEDSDSDEPETTKKSALRETLQKLNESNNFMVKRSTKKKKKKKSVVKTSDKSNSKKSAAKASASRKVSTASEKTKSKSKHKVLKQSTKSSGKKSKNKKSVIAKKQKVANKKPITEKKKKKLKKSEEKSKLRQRSVATLIDNAVINQKENRKEMELTKPICSACLGEKSDDSNEIVECDSCGISVHEVCYGLSADNVSISSGSGSSSCTEPWFCDVCKSGSENIFCELCPVEGGLFKESTAGRWVHLVCAMYTQGVALHNDSTINLYEIHYARWGSHNCAACENERQAQTGIVIPCDAGMCKTYFHATCAQKLGLLSDPNQVDFAEADPYYVSCKLHTNRETVKRRIRIFNTLQEQLRIKRERKELQGLPSGSNEDQARILRKLEKVRQKTALKRAHYLNSLENVPSQCKPVDQLGFSSVHNLPNSWINGNKKQRLMHTSAKLGNDFVRKTERLGEDIVALELEVKHEKIFSNVKRKWNVLPAMSVEYSSYYADRENRISVLMDQCEKSVKENSELIDKEISLKDVWETHVVNQMAMSEETDSVSKQLESLASMLTFICPSDKRLSTKLHSMVKPKDLFGGRKKSPSTSRSDRKSPTPRRLSTTLKKSPKNRVTSPSPSRSGKLAVAVCDTCSKSDNQHLITRCDKCKKHYHLGCLDPPLSRMPKRSRLCGWMCSDCCEAPSENEDHVDTEAPRTLRGRTKIRKPGKYRGSDESEEDTKIVLDPENKTGTKKSSVKLHSSPDGSETKLNAVLLVSPVPVSTGSPVDRRRRSGSANLSSPRHTNPMISPVEGQILKTEMDSQSHVEDEVISHVVNSAVQKKEHSKARLPKGKKTLTKVPKLKRKKDNKTASKLDKVIGDSATSGTSSPLKRKPSDGPLTNFKVNGINESKVPVPEEIKSAVPKLNKKKKISANNIVTDLMKNGITSVEGNIPLPVKGKAKSKLKKKRDANPMIAVREEELVKVEPAVGVAAAAKAESKRPKKPRKKKGQLEIVNEPIEQGKQTKKLKKKPVKSRVASQSALAPRDEKNGVNIVMGKVTSQILENKMKEIQNGAVKSPTSRKRKNSTLPNPESSGMPVSTSASVTSVVAPHDEKEKCVPPKKRKRAPSTANQQTLTPGVLNSVDSIIKAVASGNFADGNLENGDHGLSTTEVSIMQGIAPMSRRMAPEQNIMQGKAMGSGTSSSSETVTVDASFIIDGPTSIQSSFSGSNSYYCSSQLQTSTGNAHDEGALLKLTGVVNEGFRFQTSDNSSGSDNVIRLQYIDSGVESTSTVSDSVAMPPPAPPAPTPSICSPHATSPNIFTPPSGVCATCTKTDIKMQLVMCDKCQLEFHFMCLTPALKYSPRRKGIPWFCKDCDDEGAAGTSRENGIARHLH